VNSASRYQAGTGNRFMLHRNQAHAPYLGGELHERTLVPAAGARLGETRFDHWMNQSAVGIS
jgi:hypothetical protein